MCAKIPECATHHVVGNTINDYSVVKAAMRRMEPAVKGNYTKV